MGVEPRVSAVAAAGVVGLIGQCGGDADRIFGAARLDMRAAGDPAALLDLNRYCDLFEQAARQTAVDDFGLRFGKSYRLENMGTLGELVLASPTLGEALKNLCRYFPALQEHSTLALRDDGDLVRLEYQIRDGRILLRRQDAELSIGIFNNVFVHCFGPSWAPVEIHFEHLRAAETGAHQTLLNAPVYFGQPANAILLRREWLAKTMPGARPDKMPALKAELARRAEAARPDDFVGRVVQEIRLGFCSGQADVEAVSARLGMSRATLYRALAAKNFDFSRLTETVRRELALIYIRQAHIHLTEIAALLGYSELSAFSRAFKRWTQLAPAAFRARIERPGGAAPWTPARAEGP
jgi:AraC-like DNA-binding protein